ncbi:metal-dependent hydrolase [Geomonas sp. Red276]
MRYIFTLAIVGSLLVPSLSRATVTPVPLESTSQRISTMEALLDRAMAQNLIAGGVVVIGNRQGIIATSARGHLTPSPASPLLDEHTVFDIASLTKVVATAPAVMKLLDEGKIALTDPISRWFPEFAQPSRSEITVQHLLTHTSGLDDISVSSDQPMQSAIRKAAAERRSPTGRFHYADINFILLGELVRRVSGSSLDVFCQNEIFGPLGDRETMFLPSRAMEASIAPTSGYSPGVVQDPNARRLGGVAGHAGLFTSAYDLSRYARLMLGMGMLDNQRVLSEQVVAEMTSPHSCSNGQVWRGLGWDMNSPFAAPKGNLFSDASFGHTGYSGSSIWIDPKQDLFVILLTRRVNYRDTHSFNQLRREVSTVASATYNGGSMPFPINDDALLAEAAASDSEPAPTPGRIEVYEKDGILVATNIHTAPEHVKARREIVQHHFAKVVKSSAKKCSVRKGRVSRVAKADRSRARSRKHRLIRG